MGFGGFVGAKRGPRSGVCVGGDVSPEFGKSRGAVVCRTIGSDVMGEMRMWKGGEANGLGFAIRTSDEAHQINDSNGLMTQRAGMKEHKY